MRTRSAVSALSGTLLVLTLSGCSDDPAPVSGDPQTSTSPSEPSSDDSGDDDALDAAGAEFLERLRAGMGEEGSVHVEMEMSGPVESTAEGDTTYGPDGSEMRLTMQMSSLGGRPMEMVLADGKAWMSMPGVTGPGEFFEVDQSNPAFSGLDDGLSPADAFDAFEAGLEGVEELGPDEIAGEPTTRYRLEVDAESALEATGQTSVPGLPETLSYDVWLDSEDRMRRLVYELTGTRLTMDMTDWGEDVTIEAPDPDDVVDAPPMMGG